MNRKADLDGLERQEYVATTGNRKVLRLCSPESPNHTDYALPTAIN